MTITLADFEPYTDRDGLIHTRKVDPATGKASTLNGVCYTGEVLALLGWIRLASGLVDYSQQIHAINSCLITKGLLQRLPVQYGKTDQQGPDDYMGALAGMSAAKEFQFGQDYIDYGKRNYGFYNNVNPGRWEKSAFLARFPQITAMAYWCARKPAPLFNTLWAAGTIYTSQRKPPEQDQDAYRFTALLIAVHMDQHPQFQSNMIRKAGEWWWRRFWEKGYSMEAIVTRYLNEKDHPLAKLWGQYESEIKFYLRGL